MNASMQPMPHAAWRHQTLEPYRQPIICPPDLVRTIDKDLAHQARSPCRSETISPPIAPLVHDRRSPASAIAPEKCRLVSSGLYQNAHKQTSKSHGAGSQSSDPDHLHLSTDRSRRADAGRLYRHRSLFTDVLTPGQQAPPIRCAGSVIRLHSASVPIDCL